MVDTVHENENLDVARPIKVFTWRDIVVLCDDGRSRVEDYSELLPVAQAQLQKYPHGFGVLSIIPGNAVPPPEPVRQAINQTLNHVQSGIRCLCWLIEGSGFQAAMVRAVLAGMRVLSTAPYARHVSTDLEFSLTWILSLLEGGPRRVSDVHDAVRFVRAQLALLHPNMNVAAL